MKDKSIIWIVGGSYGIGIELVKIFLQNEHSVIVSSRNTTNNEKLQNLITLYPTKLAFVDFDVQKNDADAIIQEVIKKFGMIDIWFYNVGTYEVMSVDKWKIENFIEMNETNYLGVVKIMTSLMQYCKDKSMRWIWNVSLSSYVGLPYGGGYSAPKAALVNLAESIYLELKNKQIDLQIINHGFVKTRLTEKNEFPMPGLISSEECALKIFEKISVDKSFEIRFPYFLSFALRFLSFIPYKIFFALTKKLL